MGQIKVDRDLDGIKGLCLITPTVHGDSRGYFTETYSKRDMVEAGFDIEFVQDNQSMSSKGVLRGLHFQKKYPQLIYVPALRVLVVGMENYFLQKTIGSSLFLEDLLMGSLYYRT